MTEISRSTLFGKLNSVGYRAVEGATVFCKLRGNPYVELVHWLHQILQVQDSDLHRIIRHFELDAARLAADIPAALDKLPRGATSISDFSPHIEETIERAWVLATLMFGEHQVRTGHLLLAGMRTSALRNVLLGISRQFDKVKAEALGDDFAKIVAGSPEDALSSTDGAAAPGEASGAMAPAAMGKGEALAKFAVDLTDRARKGELDPIVGRDTEIRQVVDILMRRRQNNPIMTGEAGVGKTAVVEGFAHRIVAGDVPPALKDVKLMTLDIGLLQAGASMKGEFENRLRQVIEEVQSSPTPIILFIDEAHTLIGAGGAAGTGDAANLLKPALARGTLRTIAATTWAEYKKYFEKDPALTRRFQVVQVDEPSEQKAILMMRGIALGGAHGRRAYDRHARRGRPHGPPGTGREPRRWNDSGVIHPPDGVSPQRHAATSEKVAPETPQVTRVTLVSAACRSPLVVLVAARVRLSLLPPPPSSWSAPPAGRSPDPTARTSRPTSTRTARASTGARSRPTARTTPSSSRPRAPAT